MRRKNKIKTILFYLHSFFFVERKWSCQIDQSHLPESIIIYLAFVFSYYAGVLVIIIIIIIMFYIIIMEM